MTRLAPSLAATVVSGVLYALAFPPLRLRALAWIALVPFLAALRHASWRRRLGLGALWTLVSGWSVGTWMAPAVASYFDQPLLVGVAIFLVVTVGMATPYYAAFALAYGPLARLGAATPLLAGAAWAAAELARGRLLNGALGYVGNSPWATLGYSQAGLLPVVQIAAVAGVYGVSFLVATANAALAELVAERGERRSRRGALAAGAVVAGAVAWGALAVGSVPPDAASTPIAIVQGNLGAAVRWSAEGPARTLEAYQHLTRELLAADAPAIVFWPEAALTSFIEHEDTHRRALVALLAGRDVELVFGAPRAGTPAGGPPYANSVYRIGPDGALDARYDKEWLLPFMEYLPLRFDFARRHFGRVREFTPGAPTPPLPTRAGAAGLLVCNEAFLPHVAAARVAAGATYLASPSNDSWVPNAGFAWQQFDIAAMRAVEQRRFLVRVSDSGPSGVVDPWGRVVAHTDARARATLRATIVPTTAPSLYARAGDAFGVACALVALLGCALAHVRRGR
ncbi:MAG: apolipoprotein N-acyltransferase [Deltaproteobacteria bacterium]|nr:apolipoprotein N-acyltransferase [Deltaproteobacteria bacterium]